MSDQLDEMYRDVILDHYRSPRGKKDIAREDIISAGHNPSCGDELDLSLEVDSGKVKDIHVDCRGCAISTASGSILAEIVKGKTLAEAKQIAGIVKSILKGEETEIPDNLGDVDALQGVRQFPVRIKCALLAWVTLLEGIESFENGKSKPSGSVSTEEKE